MLQKVALEKSPPQKNTETSGVCGQKNIEFLKDSNIKNITRKSELPTSTIPKKSKEFF